MPSPQFIKSYFSSFTDDIISQPLQKGEKKDEDKDKEGEAAEVTERSEFMYNYRVMFVKLVELSFFSFFLFHFLNTEVIEFSVHDEV